MSLRHPARSKRERKHKALYVQRKASKRMETFYRKWAKELLA